MKTSGKEIILLVLIYLRVTALLTSSRRFILLNFIVPLSRGERSTHFILLRNETRIF
jgi:hypothetical protein